MSSFIKVKWLLKTPLQVVFAPYVSGNEPSMFPTYSAVRKVLGLQLAGRIWDDSLDRQGMRSLANWAHDNGYPSLTEFIISGEMGQPAYGYFKFLREGPTLMEGGGFPKWSPQWRCRAAGS